MPLGERKVELKNHRSGLSSEEADNHLIGFGEFAAMYLYVFGNAQGWLPQGLPEIQNDHVPVHFDKR
jgi:hypothetical protein